MADQYEPADRNPNAGNLARVLSRPEYANADVIVVVNGKPYTITSMVMAQRETDPDDRMVLIHVDELTDDCEYSNCRTGTTH